MKGPDPVRSESYDEMVADLAAKHGWTPEQIERFVGDTRNGRRNPAPNAGWYEGDPRSKGVAVKRRGRGRS